VDIDKKQTTTNIKTSPNVARKQHTAKKSSSQHGSGICEQRADCDFLQVALRASSSSLSLSQQDEDFTNQKKSYPGSALLFHESLPIVKACFGMITNIIFRYVMLLLFTRM